MGLKDVDVSVGAVCAVDRESSLALVGGGDEIRECGASFNPAMLRSCVVKSRTYLVVSSVCCFVVVFKPGGVDNEAEEVEGVHAAAAFRAMISDFASVSSDLKS